MTQLLLLLIVFFSASSCQGPLSAGHDYKDTAVAIQLVSGNEPEGLCLEVPAVAVSAAPAPEGHEPAWAARLREQIARIDSRMPGSLAVYVKDPEEGHSLSYNTGEDRYFASTTKIPVAIAILQRVEAGEFTLDHKLVLKESDFVDGNGDILWQRPGKQYSISTLLEKMIQDSDNCATDMLIRLIGQDDLNEQIRLNMISWGFNPITTILQVRHDAFSEIHENAAGLSNMDILNVNRNRAYSDRLSRLLYLLAIEETQLKATSIEEAFERYYLRGFNSGRLEAMGHLLERLYRGELLDEAHTSYLIHVMQNIRTGDRRIKAGLPKGSFWAHKTGTQVRTAANAGILLTKDQKPLIVVVNARSFNQLSQAENAMREIGKLLGETFPLN